VSRSVPVMIARSAGAATISQLTRVVVIFGVHVLLRHRVPQEDWGLWNWTEAVFLILGAIRDLGLPAHTLRLRPRPFGNLLLAESVWGGLLVLGSFATAPLLAQAFSQADPRLISVIRTFCFFVLLDGLAQVPLMYFEGDLKLGRALVPELTRHLSYAAIAASLALLGMGVWSMVVAQLASTGLWAALLWLKAWGRIPLVYQRGRTLRLFVESLPLGSIWLVMLVQTRLDPLILGWRFEEQVVGAYGFGFWVAFLVATIMVHPVGRAVYPALVGFVSEPRHLFQVYRIATLLLLALEAPAALFLFLNADLTVLILGGAKWQSTPDFLRILCFVPLIDPLGRFAGQLFAARRQEWLWVVSAIVNVLALGTGGVLLTLWLGPKGMAISNFFLLGSVLVALGLHALAPREFWGLLRELLVVYAVPVPLFGIAWLLTPDQPVLRMALSAAAALGTFGLYYKLFGPAVRRFFREDFPAPPEGETSSS